VLAIVCQAALAADVPVWSAIAAGPVGAALDTPPGVAWAVRGLAWAALGLVVLGPRPLLRPNVLVAARLGADGVAVRSPLGPAAAGAVTVLAVTIAAAAAFAGHAGAGSVRWLSVPSATVHVLAMSAWLGALVLLLGAVPAAARRLPAAASRDLLTGAV